MRFCLFNVENFYLLFDTLPSPGSFETLSEKQWQMLSSSIYENKSLYKCTQMAKTFLDINADVYMLCEVGGIETLQNFSKLFLNDTYHPCLVEGNSNRHLDVGFLIKKSAPFYFDISTNRNRPIHFLYSVEVNNPPFASHKFSRDVAELRLFTKDREKPFLMILHCHLKSPRDQDRIDPNGFERRQAELKELMQIYLETEKKFNSQLPILVSGDFNGTAASQETEPEFKPIYELTQLKESLEIAQTPKEYCSTFYQTKPGGYTRGRQIDYIFMNPTVQPFFQNSFVYKFKDHIGKELDPPMNMIDKLKLPSDHYPVVLDIVSPQK